jgi:hypothetical protein
MADKHTYTVNRAMHGDGKDYARGDTRELSETDAAPLLATGALSLKGKDPVEREPAVRHTFGQEPSRVNAEGYTSASGDGVAAPRAATSTTPTARGRSR